MSLLDAFMAKVDVTDKCWLWTAGRTAAGYGVFWVRRHPVYAHRWSYEHHVGAVPAGMQLDHLCRVRHCVRPDHLEAVEQAENIARGDGASARNAAKTHCPRGHVYDATNTYVTRNGWRQCRACKRMREAS